MKGFPLRAAAFVILAPLVLWVIAATLGWQALQASGRAAAVQDQLARAVARPRPADTAQGQPLLIPGATEGSAASAFQSALRTLAAGGGAEVVQVESAPAEPDAPLSHLHLTARLRGTEAQIVATLRAIEAAEPLIVVDRLDMQGEGQENGAISVTLSLSAWAAEVGK